MMGRWCWSLLLGLGLVVACGGPTPSVHRSPSALQRRTALWADSDGIDEGSAFRLQKVGVDEIVVRRGTVRLTGGAPVLRLVRGAQVEGPLPVAIALRVEDMDSGADGVMAASLWGALSGELGGESMAEIILDMPKLEAGAGAFLAGLAEVSGLSVVPMLTLEQLHRGAAAELEGVVDECLVPLFGTDGADFRGVGQLASVELEDRLRPLTRHGLKLRAGIVLRPRSEPSLGRWGGDLNSLCENDVAEMSTASALDRSFQFRRDFRWAGRDWKAGETVALRWIDAARLNFFFRESGRLVMPDLAGWDLVPLPPLVSSLGMDRNALVEYLEGRGPEPHLELRVERRGSNLRATLHNTGPFASAVSTLGNWLEVSLEEGALRAQGRGDFERVVLGTNRGGKWQTATGTTANTVRFLETYVAPRETIRSDWVRLPSSRSEVRVRWNVTLTTGEEYTGSLRD